MKCANHKPWVQSLSKKHFYFDITQTETFTTLTELLKLCNLLILVLPTDKNISPTSPLGQVRAKPKQYGFDFKKKTISKWKY